MISESKKTQIYTEPRGLTMRKKLTSIFKVKGSNCFINNLIQKNSKADQRGIKTGFLFMGERNKN